MESIADAMEKLIDKDKYAAVVDSIMSNEEIQKFIADNDMQETEIRKSYPKFFEYIKTSSNEAFIGFTKKLVYHNGYAEVVYTESEESRRDKETRIIIGKLKSNSLLLDSTVKNSTFDNFKVETEEEEKALDFSLKLAEFYINGGEGNAFMSGPAGSGKSHLSMSVLKKYVAETRKTALFVSYSHVMRLIKDSFSNKDSVHTQEKMFNMLTRVDLLVIDDIGSEKNSEFSEEFLTDILDSRISTIITTNLSSDDLRGNGSKKGRYNVRTTSRMFRGIGKKAFNFKNIKDKRVLPF